ncbi:A disintegrin and metalloproteinase with thrombospondin motifs adt-1-like [Photinus pyralis]|nr:A disintegrin and metalloproteinase with thrombospondin motifs adt-1-like [Photinus pyralis]
MLVFEEALDGSQNRIKPNFSFKAFGRSVSLNLKPNEKLISPHLKSYIYNGGKFERVPFAPESCHYIHRDELLTAAISSCDPNSLQGFLFLNNFTYGILPLTPQLHSVITLASPLLFDAASPDIQGKVPHVAYRLSSSSNPVQFRNIVKSNPYLYDGYVTEDSKPLELTAEVALFFDAEAYQKFAPYFKEDETKLREMLLIYMNGIQALYHHPSLGTKLDFVLVRLDIMKTQPADLPDFGGERSKLLDSFCNYQKKLNPTSDDDPQHWDLGLYVSGLDLFELDETGQGSTATLGLSTVGGVCYPQYACIIAEMGATNIFGEPYPSAGFSSVYISAHEIGHNLGMHHDGTKNNCPVEGYIMSPSRGTSGETQWSSCSAEVMANLLNSKCLQDFTGIPNKNLDHSIHKDLPGQAFSAKKQCEILLRDKDAVVSPNRELSKLCDSIECKTPNRGGSYFAGPALDGTECGKRKYCFGGECVPKALSLDRPVTLDKSPMSNYPKWKLFENQMSTYDYASRQCKHFSKLLPFLNLQEIGLQIGHEEENPWMACAIFCQKSDFNDYYTPRAELHVLGLSPYFPDGTWCHSDRNVNYFCRQHLCVPEVRERVSHFVPISPQKSPILEPNVDISDEMEELSSQRIGF